MRIKIKIKIRIRIQKFVVFVKDLGMLLILDSGHNQPTNQQMASGRDYKLVFREIPRIVHDEMIEYIQCVPETRDYELLFMFRLRSERTAKKMVELRRPSEEEVTTSALKLASALEVTKAAGGCKCKGTQLCYRD